MAGESYLTGHVAPHPGLTGSLLGRDPDQGDSFDGDGVRMVVLQSYGLRWGINAPCCRVLGRNL